MNLIPNITNEKLLSLYKQMWLIRLFDEKLEEFFAKKMMHGTTHLTIVQEATAAGACAVMKRTEKFEAA